MDDSSPHTRDDARLVLAARHGDEGAFETLIDRYRTIVLGVTWSALQDFDDAEDATQETFIQAYRHLHHLKNPASFAPWLSTIARNVVRKRLAHRTLEDERLRDADAHAAPVSHKPESGEETFTPEMARAAFAALSPSDRATATLFYLVRLPQDRIAELLGVSVGTVKSRLHRSRHHLHRRLLDMARQTFNEQNSDVEYGRAVIAGMRGVIHWKTLLEPEGLEGWCSAYPDRQTGRAIEEIWSRKGDAITGADTTNEGACLVAGDASWTDYELALLVTPLSGGNAQVLVRVSEDRKRWYLIDLMLGWQAIQVCRVDTGPQGRGLERLSVVNCPVVTGHEYDLMIAARGASITTYLDGKLMNQATDFTYASGPIGLNVWQSSTVFRDPRVRLLS